MKDLFWYIVMGLALIIFGVSMWYLARYINYNLSYKDLVTQTIVESVKSECLIK